MSSPIKRSIAIAALGAVLSVGAASCRQLLSPTPQERLLGTWEWVDATGGIAGQTRTPESTGETMSIRFSNDDSVRVSKDGEPFVVAGFALGKKGEEGSMSVTYAPPVFAFETQSVRFVMPDTLVLTDPCCDGFIYRFVRSSW